MHFLSLFDKGIVLRDSSQCQLIHQIDDVSIWNEFLFETLDCIGTIDRSWVGEKGQKHSKQIIGKVHQEKSELDRFL